VTTHSASEAYERVLDGAGATRPRRDAVDTRVVAEVRRGGATVGNGIIDSPAQVGGWPDLKSAPAPRDTDGDGMPDEWENARGLNPRDPADRNSLRLHPVHTALEILLSELAGDSPSRQNAGR
jgi:hypothetical protein